MTSHFKTAYPWVQLPAIVNGPMLNIAGPELVFEVTKAGGLAFMAAGKNVDAAHANLKKAQELTATLGHDGLPIGLGVQCFTMKLEDFVDLVETHRPVAVWLFAARHLEDYATWSAALRPLSKVWIQTNSVADAKYLQAYADVLVMQGVDAGGHGAEKAAGVISLVPETIDAVDVPVVAAGGIADGRSVAAVLALGAVGACMGTRFLASKEAVVNESYRKAILHATDGGQSTLKHKIYDRVAGIDWPTEYDARGLRNATTKDLEDGVDDADNAKSFKGAAAVYETIQVSRANAWAGTGVGLVRETQGAGDIVREVRSVAVEVLKRRAGEYA